MSDLSTPLYVRERDMFCRFAMERALGKQTVERLAAGTRKFSHRMREKMQAQGMANVMYRRPGRGRP